MTLIELVLVMGLIALVMGVGLGLFASLRPGERAAVSLVQSTLRRASNSALHQNANASVMLEPGGNKLRAAVLRTIGTWHFEDSARVVGAFELNGTLDAGGEISEDGWQARALSFEGAPPRAEVSIPVQQDPAWNFEYGFAIECALRRSGDSGAPLLRIGQSIVLELGAKGELSASFLSKVFDAQGIARPGEKTHLRSAGPALSANRWQVLRLGYDMARFWLSIDGTEVASVETQLPVWKVEGALVLGGGDRPFAGSIDALCVRTVESDQVQTLPAGVIFAKDAPQRVSLAAGGGLDVLQHAQPVRLELEYSDGRRQPIQIEFAGTVQ